MPSARLCIDLRVAAPVAATWAFKQSVIYFGCLVVAVILHEISHGVVALWFGDDTAKKAGRLTLNPIPHIDPFGSIILPAFGALSGIPVIAWAKPVPVNPSQMRNPRRDMLWVGLVGPFTNFALMVGAALVARSLFREPSRRVPFVAGRLPARRSRSRTTFALANLFLGVFNLLPIPPLDGSSLLERILPESLAPALVPVPAVRDARALRAGVLHPDPAATLISPFENDSDRFIVAMNAPHLVRRFFGALWPGRAARRGRGVGRAGAADPRSCCCSAGCRTTTAATRCGRAPRPSARSAPTSEPRWIAAAMLHDVGKYDADLSVPGRAVATRRGRRAVRVASRVERWQRRARAARAGSRSTREHGELGRRARSGGPAAARRPRCGPRRTITPRPGRTSTIPHAVVAVLDAADQT